MTLDMADLLLEHLREETDELESLDGPAAEDEERPAGGVRATEWRRDPSRGKLVRRRTRRQSRSASCAPAASSSSGVPASSTPGGRGSAGRTCRARGWPTTAWHGTPPGAPASRPPLTSLPARLWRSSRPSPVTTARAARMRASKPTASSTNGATGDELGAEPGPQPAGQAARGAGHRDPAGIAGEPRASRAKPRGQRPHLVRPRPLLRPEHPRGRLERRPHVAQHDDPRVAQPARCEDRLDRPGAAVGGRAASDADVNRPRPELDRGGDQLARATRARGDRVALALGDEPEPAGRGHLDDRERSPRRPKPASIARPSGSLDRDADRLEAEHRRERRERPFAPVGERAERRLAGRGPPGRGRSTTATSVAENVPLKLSGATRTSVGMPTGIAGVILSVDDNGARAGRLRCPRRPSLTSTDGSSASPAPTGSSTSRRRGPRRSPSCRSASTSPRSGGR